MNDRRGFACWTFSATLIAVLLGCSADEQAEVRGKVSLDGQPVEDGTITFTPKTGSRNQAWAPIKAGEFLIDTSGGLGTGVSRVEVRALRRTGKILPNSMGGTEPEYEMQEAVPSRYNSASQLTADIKPGMNQLDFDLKSK